MYYKDCVGTIPYSIHNHPHLNAIAYYTGSLMPNFDQLVIYYSKEPFDPLMLWPIPTNLFLIFYVQVFTICRGRSNTKAQWRG